MATAASSSLFERLTSVWRLLSLRSDVDNVILELLGHFSLEKIYSEGENEAYQDLVSSLIAQLSAIFYIQRLSLPSEDVQANRHLRFLVSWEVAFRSVEFVLQIIVEGRERLWGAWALRNKYLAELLLSALRVLMLHPKASPNQRGKDRRDRFTRIHKALERICDSYPGPRSFLLSVSREMTEALRVEPHALGLPTKLRHELPNLTTELYPFPPCLSSQYVSTIGQDGSSDNWLSQFLALRDISQFVVGAFLQQATDRDNHEVLIPLQSSSASIRSAILQALESVQLPSHLSRLDMIDTFSETFGTILPDTPNLVLRDSVIFQAVDHEIDAMDALCARLNERELASRLSDHEVMYGISDVTRAVALLDDPNGHFMGPSPRLYASNCRRCHFVGHSQLRRMKGIEFPLDPGAATEIRLPSQSKCVQCGESITMVREITLARHTWNMLKPLEPDADALSIERHMVTQFQLAPPKPEYTPRSQSHSEPSGAVKAGNMKSRSADPSSSYSGLSVYPSTASSDQLISPLSPQSPSSQLQRLEIPRNDSSASWGSRPNTATQRAPGGGKLSEDLTEPSHSPKPVVSIGAVPPRGIRTVEKKKPGWKSKFTGLRKDSQVITGDASSLSSATLESQRLEELPLGNLTNPPKTTSKAKSNKNVYVYLSQNSSNTLFWTHSSIQLWDVGTSPPSLWRALSTESHCVLAAVTKTYLAYIVGTRDQRLTLRILNLVQTLAPPVEYRMASSPWCKSLTICPKENYIAVGFENAMVRFFKTTNSEQPRQYRLHSHHQPPECKECPAVETLSFSSDGLNLLASTRSSRSGIIQIYTWRFPFLDFQELSTCQYYVPLHESEDNGVSSAILRPRIGREEPLVCITTWTQSGVPILVQSESGYKSDIKTEYTSRASRLGNRIQCGAFSPSGRILALVNDKGFLYEVSSLNSDPIGIRRIATSKELTNLSTSYSMAFMKLVDEDAIVLAWAEPGKAIGFVKKIPITSSDEAGVTPINDIGPAATVNELNVDPLELPGDDRPPPELHGDAKRRSKLPAELPATEKPRFGFRRSISGR